MPDWNPKANEIFVLAAELDSADERAAFVAQRCGQDADLRGQVESLLAASQQAGTFLEAPAVPAGVGNDPTADVRTICERPGTTIGPYKLLQEIGEGGFGTVFMAEQEKPVRRVVALKVIKPGMDSQQVIARFESERQALALMNHPNIAKVLDAGATQTGRPYFVMELVKGVPITEFCDKNHMPAEHRLNLFIAVCHAIQHAHHKGVIHRDIKPSNVMVTLHDTVPVVKVIDFGVAKATVQKLTEKTMFTAYGQMIGTPAYMSPEQAEMSGLDIDTRSDIYSLGVLLYELLTGTTPLAMKRLREAGYAEMQRIIRNEDAPRPSTRVTSLGDSATVLAGNRGTDPKHLARLLAGDLDWIVMKALEKDRNRRYATPGTFAEDIERYLRHDAIDARPPSPRYRLQKFARRNRVAVLTSAAIAAALLIGIVVATWQAVRATRAESLALAALGEKEAALQAEAQQRQRAEDNEALALAAAEAEKAAREKSELSEAETRAVLDFVENKVFSAARPEGQEGGLGHDVTLRKAIESSTPFVEENFEDQPLIEARLRRTLGVSFSYLGEAELSRQQYERALALMKTKLGPDHPETLRSMQNLADSYAALGRHPEALKLYEETLALKKTQFGPNHPSTLASMNGLANSYSALGWYSEAQKLHEETYTLNKAALGPNHPNTLSSMNNLANSYDALGRYEEALKLREETLLQQKNRLGPLHPETLTSMHNLANSYFAVGRRAEAIKLYEQTLALRKDILGADHPDSLASMNNLANSYDAVGRYNQALKLREQTLDLRSARLGPEHPDTVASMSNLANSYYILGRHVEALKLYEETLALRKAKLGPDHPETLRNMHNLANSCEAVGRYAEALKLREETLVLLRAKLGPDHPDTWGGISGLANTYAILGRFAEAIKLYEETLVLRKSKLGPDHPDTLVSMSNLANSYYSIGRHAEAIQLYDETSRKLKANLGPDHPYTLANANSLAWSLATVPDAALRDPQRAVELAALVVESAPENAAYRRTLGSALYRAGLWKGAVGELEQAISLGKGDDPNNAYEGFFLAMAHWQMGEKDKAHEWFDKSVALIDANKALKVRTDLIRFRAEAASLLGVDEEEQSADQR